MNVKVNIKRPQISKEEIAAHKDFGDLLKQYKASARKVVPFYRTTWFYTSMSAAAAVVAAIVIYIAPKGSKNTYASLTAPMEKVDVVTSQYAVNADQGTTITYKTGSVVKIPAKAFVDKLGNPVSGKVDLTYRELKDPIDFFIAGIPMNYTSKGVDYTFESAGIIEIRATQKGEELSLSPDKTVDVALASHQPGNSFSLYKLDVEKKEWMLQGKEQEMKAEDAAGEAVASNENTEADPASTTEPAAVSENESKLASIENEIIKSRAKVRRMEASRPYEPEAESKGSDRFAVSVSNLRDFPELALYSDVMFQATANNVGFNDAIYNEEWQEATLAKNGNGYVLNLKKDDGGASYSVRPVFEGEGYITAQRIYKQKIADYETALVELKAIEGERQQQLASLADVVKKSLEAEAAMANQAAAKPVVNPGNLTFHSFAVNGTGIWGLNSLTTSPLGASLIPHFIDEKGKEIAFRDGKVYMVERGRNTFFSFSETASISFNPEKENMLWGITEDHKIAVFRYEDFKTINKQSGDYIFAMQVSESEPANESQMEYYLNI